ncbi:hypothetical protein FB440_104186 [Vibrio crassostreae]|uniref:hypothetical protein n=1 Tax=Vibrio TaxID=662 RepID=UPI000D378E95|nr:MULTISPECIES: hypothetical protein [Vibrio]PTP97893.1 hypothetical protein CWO34_13530 [Vibrio splendidus]TWD41023.1 hypothetical protein FB440_104186 [Vibrio crassostreae]
MLFNLSISLVNQEVDRVLNNESKVKFLTIVNQLNQILLNDEFENESFRRQYVRNILEEELKLDRELLQIVLRLRTEARKEFLKAIEREQDGLWIYYLLMLELPLATSQRNKLAH